jgi:hypothetical protein
VLLGLLHSAVVVVALLGIGGVVIANAEADFVGDGGFTTVGFELILTTFAAPETFAVGENPSGADEDLGVLAGVVTTPLVGGVATVDIIMGLVLTFILFSDPLESFLISGVPPDPRGLEGFPVRIASGTQRPRKETGETVRSSHASSTSQLQ